MKFFLVLCLSFVGPLPTEPLRPEKTETRKTIDISIETWANAAFDEGDYATAGFLLPAVVWQSKDNPDKVKTIEEKSRICEKLKRKQPATDDRAKALMKHRKLLVRPKDGDALLVGMRELGNFEYDPEKCPAIPEDIKKLDGTKLRTYGFVIARSEEEKFTDFDLIPNFCFSCCNVVGERPLMQQILAVHLPKDKAVSYPFFCPVIVEGTLTIGEKKRDGFVTNIFEMDCTSVKPMQSDRSAKDNKEKALQWGL